MGIEGGPSTVESSQEDWVALGPWILSLVEEAQYDQATIYVNGSNNLPNLRKDDENWKVRLTEEEFMKRMWDVEGA